MSEDLIPVGGILILEEGTLPHDLNKWFLVKTVEAYKTEDCNGINAFTPHYPNPLTGRSIKVVYLYYYVRLT